MNNHKKRIAIFVSGSGTNMENIAKHVQSGKLSCEIGLVVCDQPQAFALERAKRFGIEMFVIERKNFRSKIEFESAITKELERRKIDFIVLAGYMKILGPEFVRHWQWKILNIHPSLLPKYPGGHSIKDAFSAKEKETGVTVHFVDEGVDSGPIILQRKVDIKPNDTLEALESRVHETEYQLYPEVIQLFCENKLTVQSGRVTIR